MQENQKDPKEISHRGRLELLFNSNNILTEDDKVLYMKHLVTFAKEDLPGQLNHQIQIILEMKENLLFNGSCSAKGDLLHNEARKSLLD